MVEGGHPELGPKANSHPTNLPQTRHPEGSLPCSRCRSSLPPLRPHLPWGQAGAGAAVSLCSAHPSSQCSLSSLPAEIHFLQHH